MQTTMVTKRDVLDHGFVELIDKMGSDLTVVNAARVSFGKRVTEVGPKDIKLIEYLAKHKHWTPFAHPQIQLHIKLPIFVARQFMKSTVGLVYNEVSRRYVDSPPEFYIPETWRTRPESSIKQGSGEALEYHVAQKTHTNLEWLGRVSRQVYGTMLDNGVAPEMARMILPQNTYTEFWMTGSLAAVARIVSLRNKSEAQWEIQQYAKAISEIVEPLFPHSWRALTNG